MKIVFFFFINDAMYYTRIKKALKNLIILLGIIHYNYHILNQIKY